MVDRKTEGKASSGHEGKSFLSSGFLEKIFKDHGFNVSILKALHYTRTTSAEAGFVVFSRGTGFDITKVIKTHRVEGSVSSVDQGEGWHINLDDVTLKPNPEIGRAVMALYKGLGDAKVLEAKLTASIKRLSVPRQDILLLIHTHPFVEHFGSIEGALCPSNRDLENWEDLRLSNPHMIMGIIAVGNNEAKLLLFRGYPDTNQGTSYQTFEDDFHSIHFLFELFDRSGVRYQVLNIGNTGGFADSELSKLQNFID